MPRMRKGQFETFGDGLLSICEADERCLTGTKASRVRFGSRTVGVKRYWEAKTAGNEIARMVSIPLELLDAVSVYVGDVVVLETRAEPDENSGQYRILQIQPKYDSSPPALYLSLENLIHPFKDRRNESGG